MPLDELKKLANFFLKQYQRAWQENAALRSLLACVPMSGGSKGVPGWEQILERHLADEEANAIANKRFAPFYERIEQAHLESDLLELLRKLPPTGGVQ
jgi:hypothetical protein